MAELNVEHKKSSPVWWIVLIIVALIILYFVFRSGNSNHVANTRTDTTGLMQNNINTNQNNTVAMYQWQEINTPPTAVNYS